MKRMNPGWLLAVSLLLGCNQKDREAEILRIATEGENPKAAAQKQGNNCQAQEEEVKKLRAEMVLLKKEIKTLSETADGTWKYATRFFEAGFWDGAEKTFSNFIRDYPRDARVGQARAKLVEIKKARESERKKKEESELAASLASVKVQEIFAEPRKYRGKVIDRALDCHEPEEAFAAMFSYQMSCWVAGDMSQDIRVGMKGSHVKPLASLPREGTTFKVKLRLKIIDREVQGSGIVAILQDIL